MTITYTGLLAIAWGITSAILLFAISCIWACFETIRSHSNKKNTPWQSKTILYIRRTKDGIDVRFHPNEECGLLLDDTTCKRLGYDLPRLGLPRDNYTRIKLNISTKKTK